MLWDALIVGGGAAGISAARKLLSEGFSPLIVEARSCLGGRAHTDVSFVNFPLELGAEFIHGDFVITRNLAADAGLTTVDVERYPNLWWPRGPGQPAALWSTLPAEVQITIQALFEDKHALRDFQLPPGDISLSSYLRLRGRSDSQVEVGDVLLAQTCCAAAGQLSCDDLQREMRGRDPGDGEARLSEGYVALWEWMSAGLEARLNTPVKAVHWGASGVAVETAAGKLLHGRTCIVTVSIAALQRSVISFQPALPAAKQQAFASLRMEAATKLIYHFSKQLWPDSLTFLCHEGLAARWWTPAYKRPAADAVITAYITSDRARQLDAMTEQEALKTGLQELSCLLGMPLEEATAVLVKAKRVSWADEPYVWGGYAFCPVGTADARKTLAQPEDGVLFFAGEATAHDSNPQTVHGAMDSGVRAAQEVIATLQAKPSAGVQGALVGTVG